MAAQTGRQALVKNGSNVVIIGENSSSLDFDGPVIESNPKGAAGTIRTYDDNDTATLQLDADVDDNDPTAKEIVAARANRTTLTGWTVANGYGLTSANWIVENASINGAAGELQKLTATLKTTGGFTFTPA